MFEILELTIFERQKSTSLYLQAKGIAATVLSLVSLERVLVLRLEKIIPAATLAIVSLLSYAPAALTTLPLAITAILFLSAPSVPTTAPFSITDSASTIAV